MKRKFNLGQLIAALVIVLSLGIILFQATRSESSVTFYTPGEIYQNHDQFNAKLFRVSGLVIKGSRVWDPIQPLLQFKITDLQGHEFSVRYQSIPPDLFKEGQGVVVEGTLNPDWNQKLIVADLLMVKHSEVYDTKQDHSKMREAKLLDSMLKQEKK
jgi:cytochrome c-type biogenesis protein CcmE